MNIIKLAQKWGYWDDEIETVEMNDVGLEEFAAAIRAEEREACAQVCETAYIPDGSPEDMAATNCAKAIRERGEK